MLDLQEEIGGIHPLDPLGVQLSTPVHLHHREFLRYRKKENSESGGPWKRGFRGGGGRGGGGRGGRGRGFSGRGGRWMRGGH